MTRLPGIASEIERRLLVNYRVDPEAAAQVLPAPFRPRMVRGYALAGICLIRLGSVRPSGLPAWVGLRSENAAHRFSVEWDDAEGRVRTGVYVPRRDSDAWATVLLGGRAFPGVHAHARFDVTETADLLHVGYRTDDGATTVDVEVEVADDLCSEVFGDLAAASDFFERGAVGWSPSRRRGGLEALELHTDAWRVEPARVVHAQSSYFADSSLFPPGTAVLDHALLMRKVPVSWTVPAPPAREPSERFRSWRLP